MPMPQKPSTAPLRKAGLIFRITAAVFSIVGIGYAIRACRLEAADADLALSVVQFSIALVFFAVGAACYQRARAVDEAHR